MSRTSPDRFSACRRQHDVMASPKDTRDIFTCSKKHSKNTNIPPHRNNGVLHRRTSPCSTRHTREKRTTSFSSPRVSLTRDRGDLLHMSFFASPDIEHGSNGQYTMAQWSISCMMHHTSYVFHVFLMPIHTQNSLLVCMLYAWVRSV